MWRTTNQSIQRWSGAALASVLIALWAGPSYGSDTPAPLLLRYYEDDFETEKARSDSYRHARFFQGGRIGPEEIYLAYGSYPPRTGGRPNILLYFAGGQPDGAWLGYELLPPGAMVLGGSVEFDRPVLADRGVLWVRLSNDGMNWLTLGESRGGEPVRRHAFTLPPGAPARFVELRGAGGIDNLRISIEYVPEPAGLCMLACGAGWLVCRRARCADGDDPVQLGVGGRVGPPEADGATGGGAGAARA